MRSRILPVVLTAVITTVATIFISGKLFQPKPYFGMAQDKQNAPVQFASYENGTVSRASVDFQFAAENSVKAVVHIKTTTKAHMVDADDYFGQMFGQQYYVPQQQGSGSGVVISADGYIVTNNHVIANADMVTVTFNDRGTSAAKVVSKDPTTDIAVLKVDKKNLPYLEFGNSDNVHLGQWVLAVGYPLTLDATVTAGIVSAKGRSIGINRQQSPTAIESFIQTDAAVNPGNSGGALVNTDGQLVGINSAIASPTGSYAGYSYAIPSNLVRKVANDLVQFGKLQRGYLGVHFIDRKRATPEELSAFGIDKNDGVYVRDIVKGSGAEKAGIQKGDFITQINSTPINTEPELQEQIAHYRPGDNISITYARNGVKKTATVQLLNLENNTSVTRADVPAAALGAQFRTLSLEERGKYEINSGLMVTDIGNGLLAQNRVKKDFVILSANDAPISNIGELEKVFATSDIVQLEGFYPGYKGMYYYTIHLK